MDFITNRKQRVRVNVIYCNLQTAFSSTADFYNLVHQHIGRLARMSVLDTDVGGSNPGNSMLFP